MMRNHDNRIEDAAQSIEDAMSALTRAVCLLGFSEGKEAVQRAQGLVRDTHQYIRERNAIEPWKN
ncbi:MAG: hypothetical protein QOF90_2484 [Acetobacteraceae bacterium]|jgi:hypothetical protein|nr:hypothetical protein [Acetobacteraceae bacterium]